MRNLYGNSYDSIANQELSRDSARDQRYFNSLAAQRALAQMRISQQQAAQDSLYRNLALAENIRQNRLNTLFNRQDRSDYRRDRMLDMLLENKRYADQLGFRREEAQRQATTEEDDLRRAQGEEDMISQGGADSANAMLDLATRGHREELQKQIGDLNVPTRWWMPDKGNPASRAREMMAITGGKPLFEVQLPTAKLSELLTSILKNRDDIRYDEGSGRFVPSIRRQQAKQPSITGNTNNQALIIAAQDAIRRGADPRAVAQRLRDKYGISFSE